MDIPCPSPAGDFFAQSRDDFFQKKELPKKGAIRKPDNPSIVHSCYMVGVVLCERSTSRPPAPKATEPGKISSIVLN